MEKNLKVLEYDKVLEKLASYAATTEIKEMCLSVRPKNTKYEAETEMNKTSAAFMLSEKFGAPSFGDILSIGDSITKVTKGSVLSLKELLILASVMRGIRTVHEWKNNIDADVGPLADYFNALYTFTGLETRIFDSIESEERLSDRASTELRRIRRQIISVSDGIRDKLERLIKSQNNRKYLQESIITSRDGRFVVPVKNEYRNQIDGLVHDTSSSGQTVFIEPTAVLESNNEIKMLEAKERDECEKIIRELCEEVAKSGENLLRSYEAVKQLALYFTKAFYGAAVKGVIPAFSLKPYFKFKKARHPLIEKEKVVPIDIELGENYDTLIITGPNTGGKTVSIKTAGLLSLMAASGIMLPCDEGAVASAFFKVLPDIGDEQSIEQSLSTFSSHIKNISEILKTAGRGSLVLIDELGAGTDPTEGAALAEAIIEALRKKGALVMVTTHYAELKVYALNTDGVMNAGCEFDVETLTPTYRLIIGALGKSNAFLISSRLGISKDIIDNAAHLLSGENKRFEDVIGELETRRGELIHDKENAERLFAEAQNLKEKMKRREEEFNKKMEEETRRITQSATMKAARITAEAENLLDELKEIKKNQNKESIDAIVSKARGTVKTSLAKIDELTEETEKKKTASLLKPSDIHIGDNVVIVSIGRTARVSALPDSKNRVAVEFGAIKTKVDLDDLAMGTAEKNTVKVIKNTEIIKNPDMRIDLRGKTAEEAIYELDFFIDRAVMGHAGIITVVHGKGTGVLRREINAHLKHHKNVKSYRLGTFGEGEDGVTIITLK